MTTPEENLEIALDESAEDEDRQRAIGQLETANACDKLEEILKTDDLQEGLRKSALESLATPQCKPTLENLVEDGELPDAFEGQGQTLLEETTDDVGAGP